MDINIHNMFIISDTVYHKARWIAIQIFHNVLVSVWSPSIQRLLRWVMGDRYAEKIKKLKPTRKNKKIKIWC